ncbi:MAG: prolipoprotein diacylglyceryl transferase [Pseudobacteriovorax sp.]|nr:prolipoprotein diacylglyceryl transferase [Pseudobacteriovorax sp.]
MSEFYVHDIDPIAFSILDIPVPWYWLVYCCGFFLVYLGVERLRRQSSPQVFTRNDLIDVMVSGWVGLIVGGRLFYIFAYYPGYYLRNPSAMFALWEGGMSFHGGLIGGFLAMCFMAYRKKQSVFHYADRISLYVPVVLFFGRLANFANGELVGRPTDVPWAVIFSRTYDAVPRHPSQIYEAIGEGLVLFLFLYLQRAKLLLPGFLSAQLILGYGVIRFIIEFYRSPDVQIGYLLLGLTMGHVLCAFMILVGGLLLVFRKQVNLKLTYSNNPRQ